MKPFLRLGWHFGGLAAAITGATMLGGFAAGLIAFGVWAMLGTMFDTLTERRSR